MVSKNINRQNNRYWCSENPHAIGEVPLHDLNVNLVCSECVQNHKACVF
jgi:hypothetical protein